MPNAKVAAKKAEIAREYGPFPGVLQVAGVTYDGERAWLATGTQLMALDPESGEPGQRFDVAADAGTAFDGKHFYQLTGATIQKLDAKTGKLLGTIPAPGDGGDSGMAWAEGSLWVGQYRSRKIHCVDPETGKILRSIDSDRFVTGVSFFEGELWHATWEAEQSELRHVDRESGEVLERLEMPAGLTISGLESDGKERFFCGGGSSGKLRVVRKPKR
jgi:outer membrane protein assembly factor BamB